MATPKSSGGCPQSADKGESNNLLNTESQSNTWKIVLFLFTLVGGAAMLLAQEKGILQAIPNVVPMVLLWFSIGSGTWLILSHSAIQEWRNTRKRLFRGLTVGTIIIAFFCGFIVWKISSTPAEPAQAFPSSIRVKYSNRKTIVGKLGDANNVLTLDGVATLRPWGYNREGIEFLLSTNASSSVTNPLPGETQNVGSASVTFGKGVMFSAVTVNPIKHLRFNSTNHTHMITLRDRRFSVQLEHIDIRPPDYFGYTFQISEE